MYLLSNYKLVRKYRYLVVIELQNSKVRLRFLHSLFGKDVTETSRSASQPMHHGLETIWVVEFPGVFCTTFTLGLKKPANTTTQVTWDSAEEG